MMVQVAQIVSSNIYRQSDKPLYHRGNTVLVVLDISAIVLFVIAKLYYIWKNKQREQRWGAMSEEQKEDYLQTTSDEGNKRLDFRFAH